MGDYFPEGYDKNEVAFSEGMMGSQGDTNDRDRGPALPGMENLGDDAVMMGGIEENTDIPAGMEFVMSSVPDGDIAMVDVEIRTPRELPRRSIKITSLLGKGAFGEVHRAQFKPPVRKLRQPF